MRRRVYAVAQPLTPVRRDATSCVVGADRHFAYGPQAGASGLFRARLYHASVTPESAKEHLKIAYFFRAKS